MKEFPDPHLRTFVPSNRAERRAAARGKKLEPNAIKRHGRSGMPMLKKWATRDKESE